MDLGKDVWMNIIFDKLSVVTLVKLTEVCSKMRKWIAESEAGTKVKRWKFRATAITLPELIDEAVLQKDRLLAKNFIAKEPRDFDKNDQDYYATYDILRSFYNLGLMNPINEYVSGRLHGHNELLSAWQTTYWQRKKLAGQRRKAKKAADRQLVLAEIDSTCKRISRSRRRK